MNTHENLFKKADKNLAANIMHRNTYAVNAKSIQTEDYILYTLGVEVLDGHLNGALRLNTIDAESFLNEVDTFLQIKNKEGTLYGYVTTKTKTLKPYLKQRVINLLENQAQQVWS